MIKAFPPFEPDKASYNSNAASSTSNVLPVSDGWAPAASHVPYAAALDAAPRGAAVFRSADGTQIAIAGTGTKIYSISGAGALTDVSGATYAVPTGDDWSFDRFGDRVIAANLADVVQYYDIGSSTDFANLPGTPPKARFVRTIGDFVFLYQMENDAAGLAWSGINNTEQWIAGEELSDRQSFPDGEELQALMPNGNGATLLFRTGIRTMSFVGGGLTFTFSPFMPSKGCAAPRSAVDIGRGDFVYYSGEGFYRGIQALPIGANRVDRWFAKTVREADRRAIVGVADPQQKIVLWRYQTPAGTGALLGYHWELNQWFQWNIDITGVGVYASSALTLEDVGALYASIDDVPFSLDSDAFAGGYPSLAGFDADWRLGYFTGDPMAATIETNAIEFNPGRRSYVDDIRPITDAPDFTVQVGTRSHYSDIPVWSAPLTPSTRGNTCYARSDARLHAFRLNIGAGVDWETASGLDIKEKASGAL